MNLQFIEEVPQVCVSAMTAEFFHVDLCRCSFNSSLTLPVLLYKVTLNDRLQRLIRSRSLTFPSKNNNPQGRKRQQDGVVAFIADDRDGIDPAEIALTATAVFLCVAV